MWRVRHAMAEFCVWRARGVVKVCFASFGVPAAALAASGSAASAPAAYVARSRRETTDGSFSASAPARRARQSEIKRSMAAWEESAELSADSRMRSARGAWYR